MVIRTRFPIFRQNEKRGRSSYIATRILINRRLTSPRDSPSRFRTKVACIKNNVLLFFSSFFLFSLYRFLVCPMFHFPNHPDTCYERVIYPSLLSSLSSPLLCCPLISPIVTENVLAAWAWRENQFFPPAFACFFSFLFLTHSPVKFPRQTDNTDGSLRKSLVRAKAKSDDLSLSPKATSKNFLFTFYTYKESLSLAHMHAHTHARTLTRILSSHFISNQRADFRDE